jgi:hypothetical protein
VAMRVTPETLQADWPTYRTAVQMNPGNPVLVRILKAPNDDEMRSLLKRVTGAKLMSDFHFCEVHKYDPMHPMATEVVVGNINSKYPVEAEEFIPDVFSVSPTNMYDPPPNVTKVNLDEEWPEETAGEMTLPMYPYTLSVA